MVVIRPHLRTDGNFIAGFPLVQPDIELISGGSWNLTLLIKY